MHIKLSRRLIFELALIFLVFIANFFEQDDFALVFLRYWLLMPLLGILLAVRVLELLMIRPITRSKIVMTPLMLLFFSSGILFGNEIAYLREIVRFHTQRDWFNEIAFKAPSQSYCNAELEYGCYQSVTISDNGDEGSVSATIFSDEDTVGVAVHSRNDISIVHLTYQTGLDPNIHMQVSIYSIICDYKLSDDGWYLCNSKLFGTGECFLGTCGRYF